MIYIPSPPAINNEKTIFDYPELIEFIKQGKVIIDKGRKNNNEFITTIMRNLWD